MSAGTTRPNAGQALAGVLQAKDHADALRRMHRTLRRAWQAGYETGWDDGVSDASDDEPKRHHNPYDDDNGGTA